MNERRHRRRCRRSDHARSAEARSTALSRRDGASSRCATLFGRRSTVPAQSFDAMRCSSRTISSCRRKRTRRRDEPDKQPLERSAQIQASCTRWCVRMPIGSSRPVAIDEGPRANPSTRWRLVGEPAAARASRSDRDACWRSRRPGTGRRPDARRRSRGREAEVRQARRRAPGRCDSRAAPARAGSARPNRPSPACEARSTARRRSRRERPEAELLLLGARRVHGCDVR